MTKVPAEEDRAYRRYIAAFGAACAFSCAQTLPLLISGHSTPAGRNHF